MEMTSYMHCMLKQDNKEQKKKISRCIKTSPSCMPFMTVCQSCLSCCAYLSITSQLLTVLFNTHLSNTSSSRQGYIDKIVKGEVMVEIT